MICQQSRFEDLCELRRSRIPRLSGPGLSIVLASQTHTCHANQPVNRQKRWLMCVRGAGHASYRIPKHDPRQGARMPPWHVRVGWLTLTRNGTWSKVELAFTTPNTVSKRASSHRNLYATWHVFNVPRPMNTTTYNRNGYFCAHRGGTFDVDVTCGHHYCI